MNLGTSLWFSQSGGTPFRQHSSHCPYRAAMANLRVYVAVLLIVAGAAGTALEARPPTDAQGTAAETVVARSAVSIEQAVKMAEQRFKARVVRADTQHLGIRTIYILKLLNEAGRVWTVRVDATNGAIL